MEKWVLLTIVLGVILAFIISNVIYPDWISPREQCELDCEEYNATFIEYERGYNSNQECWCKRGNEPLRIK